MIPSKFLLLASILFSFTCCNEKGETKKEEATSLFIGMDLSFQPEIQQESYVYKDPNGNTVEMLPYLKSKGVDIVRLRLWNNPQSGHSNLDEVLDYALDIKAAGLNLLLNIHYSDTWADPGAQSLPDAWTELTLEELKTAVYDYTSNVIVALDDQNTLPTIVQIGNETNQGFLWNSGRVGGSFENNWSNYLALAGEGISAVRDVDSGIKLMFHYAGLSGSDWFFSGIDVLDYDIIGLSYYPIWHGKDLISVQATLNNLSSTYDKEIMIVETAYPWTLEWNDWTNNNWGEQSQLITGYPASPSGQRKFFEDLKEIVLKVPNQKGLGICWWAPDWTAYRGIEATDGSSWENATIFDFDGKALPIINILD